VARVGYIRPGSGLLGSWLGPAYLGGALDTIPGDAGEFIPLPEDSKVVSYP